VAPARSSASILWWTVWAVVSGIHPAILADGGLRTALGTFARRSPIPVDLRVQADERLPEPVEVSAYYVVAEALTNTARHARASAVRVEVEVAADVLRVAVRDDGAGAPTWPAAPAWPASRTGWKRSAAGSFSTAHAGRGPSCARSSRSPPPTAAPPSLARGAETPRSAEPEAHARRPTRVAAWASRMRASTIVSRHLTEAQNSAICALVIRTYSLTA
jgi:hypothetical protein